jgi:DNA invertase Pin-like site-specific DNA recombinase
MTTTIIKKRVIVGLNENGRRIGESHPASKLTDHEIDLIRELYDDGMSISEIARKFEIAKSYCWDICNYYKRCQTISRFKEIEITVLITDND